MQNIQQFKHPNINDNFTMMDADTNQYGAMSNIGPRRNKQPTHPMRVVLPNLEKFSIMKLVGVLFTTASTIIVAIFCFWLLLATLLHAMAAK